MHLRERERERERKRERERERETERETLRDFWVKVKSAPGDLIHSLINYIQQRYTRVAVEYRSRRW